MLASSWTRKVFKSICLLFGVLLVGGNYPPASAQYVQKLPATRWPYPTAYPGQPMGASSGGTYAQPGGYVWQNGVPYSYVGGPTLPHVYDYRGPAYYAPQAMGNGYFNFTNNGNQLTYWRAPSGYYYPWYQYQGVPVIYQPIYYSSGTYAQAQPPLTVIFGDMGKFLDDAKTNGKLNENDYGHLKQRLSDLMGKEEELREANGGTLSSDDESSMRNDLEGLSREISYRVRA
jgi:hypothetical protein